MSCCGCRDRQIVEGDLDQSERCLERGRIIPRSKLGGSALNSRRLRIEKVANPAVAADLAPAPGNFADDPHALLYRCDSVVHGRSSKRLRGSLRFLEGASDGSN